MAMRIRRELFYPVARKDPYFMFGVAEGHFKKAKYKNLDWPERSKVLFEAYEDSPRENIAALFQKHSNFPAEVREELVEELCGWRGYITVCADYVLKHLDDGTVEVEFSNAQRTQYWFQRSKDGLIDVVRADECESEGEEPPATDK